MSDFGSSTPLNIDQCGKSDFQYWVIAPYFPNGFALLGELNKITPVSAARFSDITVTDSDVTMKVNGVPKESVPVTLYDMKNKKSMVVTCTIGDAGTNKFSLASGTCNGI